MMRHIADPVLDGADRRHLVTQAQQRFLRRVRRRLQSLTLQPGETDAAIRRRDGGNPGVVGKQPAPIVPCARDLLRRKRWPFGTS